MPQSLAFVAIHLVFSTKDRVPNLSVDIRPRLWAYFAAVTRNLECECYRAGGMADHVHILVGLSRTITIAKLVEALKVSTSLWLKTTAPHLSEFYWQRGYGVFSVSHSNLNAVCRYIDNQEMHHARATYQDEFRRMSNKCGLPLDERFAWD